MTVVRRVASKDLRPDELVTLRALFDASWADDDRFTDEDWDHTFGGVHFVVEDGGAIVSHASVVKRVLHTNGLDLATGYVEAVATSPTHRRRGYSSAIMRAAGAYIDQTFQLGALGSDLHAFYERLGWIVWKGPTAVRTDEGVIATPKEDGYILVRLTPTSPQLDMAAQISCDWRSGDVW